MGITNHLCADDHVGLDLKDDEIETFYNAVNDWIGGILNPLQIFNPLKKYSKSRKAFNYLVSKIERKIDSLEENGPDGSSGVPARNGSTAKGRARASWALSAAA